MHRKKQKILSILAFAILIIISASFGATIALLSKTPARRANIFTFANVSISLVEEKWVQLDDKDRIVYPGKTVNKDPKIKNTSENELYAYIEVTVPRANVRTVKDDESIENTKVQNLFSFDVNSDWVEIEKYHQTDDEKEIRIYAYQKVLEPGADTQTLFDTVTFLNMLEGEIDMDTELKIELNAYAIQKDSLNEHGSTEEEKIADAFEKYKAQKEAEK